MNMMAGLLTWIQKLCGATIVPITFLRLFQLRGKYQDQVFRTENLKLQGHTNQDLGGKNG